MGLEKNRRRNEVSAGAVIAGTLAELNAATALPPVLFAEDEIAPPLFAHVTTFPRLSVVVSGHHHVELSQEGASQIRVLGTGEAIFSDRNCWDRPTWQSKVELLTLLFGRKQLGISLVRHDGRTDMPRGAMKTVAAGQYDPVVRSLLESLSLVARCPLDRRDPVGRHLAQALLTACQYALSVPPSRHASKAAQTYEAICLYLQGNYRLALTRESVAEHFGIAPTHVSRLFRHEGQMRFSDYLNYVRMDRAKFLLSGYGLPIKVIARSCGFEDVGYFCRVFKRITKTTPTEYRLIRTGSAEETARIE